MPGALYMGFGVTKQHVASVGGSTSLEASEDWANVERRDLPPGTGARQTTDFIDSPAFALKTARELPNAAGNQPTSPAGSPGVPRPRLRYVPLPGSPSRLSAPPRCRLRRSRLRGW